MQIYTDIIQGSEDWDNLRSKRPTASNYKSIITGLGKESEQREQYMRSISIGMKYKVPSFKGNQWTERGHRLEPEARNLFIEKTGVDVREVAFIRRDDTIAGGSPDGLIYQNGVPIGGIEIKCYNEDKHLTICNKGVLPTHDKPQVHGSLWVSGLPIWIYILYCPEAFPRDFKMIEVTPDKYTKEVGKAVDLFCQELGKKWMTYLAEYEVDQLNQTFEQSCPNLYRAIKGQRPAISQPMAESII